MKSFFFKVSVAFYVFLYADLGEILKKFWHEKCLLIFIFLEKISFLNLCDFLAFSFSLCEKALRARGKRSAFLNSAYQKTIRTPKQVKIKIKKY